MEQLAGFLRIQLISDLCSAMLSQGKGTSFVPVPAVGVLSAFTEDVIEISGYSDMWGQYTDKLICKVYLVCAIHQNVFITLLLRSKPISVLAIQTVLCRE